MLALIAGVPRHQGRIIYLTYEGAGPIEQTLMLVGKGVTYDTGGADIKAGGVMAGMHRDKCGSAAVAGFMQILAKLQPSNIKVIAIIYFFCGCTSGFIFYEYDIEIILTNYASVKLHFTSGITSIVL